MKCMKIYENRNVSKLSSNLKSKIQNVHGVLLDITAQWKLGDVFNGGHGCHDCITLSTLPTPGPAKLADPFSDLQVLSRSFCAG